MRRLEQGVDSLANPRPGTMLTHNIIMLIEVFFYMTATHFIGAFGVQRRNKETEGLNLSHICVLYTYTVYESMSCAVRWYTYTRARGRTAGQKALRKVSGRCR